MPTSHSIARLRLFLIILTAIASVSAVVAVVGEQPQFKIKTKRHTDNVQVAVQKGKTKFPIRSSVGIGQAEIEQSNDEWPEYVVLRLYLKGLEKLHISNGKITLDATVSSHADDKNTMRLWKDGKEDMPLDSISQFWMEISKVGRGGNPAQEVAPNDEYFEMQLPKSLLRATRGRSR